ncbi:unnamed protein product [Lactuca virosa]|uniref:Uncharacterized protein n=1 Tax=Lactuca virosa TaxID=75947 RepID=A0AAU9PD53_9ASTR|nr:unnamed protein product [Lactuca virosa]
MGRVAKGIRMEHHMLRLMIKNKHPILTKQWTMMKFKHHLLQLMELKHPLFTASDYLNLEDFIDGVQFQAPTADGVKFRAPTVKFDLNGPDVDEFDLNGSDVDVDEGNQTEDSGGDSHELSNNKRKATGASGTGQSSVSVSGKKRPSGPGKSSESGAAKKRPRVAVKKGKKAN